MFGFLVAKKPFFSCVLAASWDTVEDDDFQGDFYSEIWKAFNGIELFRNLIFNHRGVRCLLLEHVFVVNKFWERSFSPLVACLDPGEPLARTIAQMSGIGIMFDCFLNRSVRFFFVLNFLSVSVYFDLFIESDYKECWGRLTCINLCTEVNLKFVPSHVCLLFFLSALLHLFICLLCSYQNRAVWALSCTEKYLASVMLR